MIDENSTIEAGIIKELQNISHSDDQQKLIEEFKKAYPEHVDWLAMFDANSTEKQLTLKGKYPKIAGFSISKSLGSGASGQVFLAQQQNPNRQVAIKVAMRYLSAEQLHRFQHESRLLASLSHPNIAQLFQSGIIEDEALPYIVMEHVDGVTIHQYCLENKLNFKQIIALFIQVLDAVQYAHNKGIVHRDVKPENILVNENGEIKLLDFGIALATENSTQQLTQLTKTGEIVGTLAYMSPEQVSGNDSLDTRADVYSLGVVLYQLLSDALPHKLDANQIFSAISQIIEDLPIKLSTQNQQIDVDLVTIVHHAIEKRPDQRYQSPRDFKLDLENWLQGEAISVKHNTFWHSIKHISRKHKALVAGSLLAIVGLVTGLIFAVSFALKEQDARLVAESHAKTSKKTVEFINALFLSADPDNVYGDKLTVLQVIDNAEASIQDELDDETVIEANIRSTIAGVFTSLDQLEKAQKQVDIVEQLLADISNTTDLYKINYEIKVIQAKIYLAQGKPENSIELLQALIAESEEGSLFKFQAEFELSTGYIMLAKYELAQQLLERMMATPASVDIPQDHKFRLFANNSYATIFEKTGEYTQAKEIYEAILAEHIELFGENHLQTLSVRNNLAAVEQSLGNSAKAQEIFEYVITERESLLGAHHVKTLFTKSNLLQVLITSGQLAKADKFSQSLMPEMQQSIGVLHPRTLSVGNMRAYLLEDLGKLTEAESLYRSTLKAYIEAGDTNKPDVFSLKNNLAMLLMKEGKLSAASEIFSQLLVNVEALLGSEHIYYALFAGNYGELLMNMDKYNKARPYLQHSYDRLLAILGENHQRTLKGKKRLDKAIHAKVK